ncbi:MAG: CofH family radical SAM protein [Proteobacteria bacterium]|nr:CofH family radical SAM protein [Verrucomicrobiota bacterium]NBU09230.1 CofH family radical SAM protein [Pseudomonadota bacterium]
MIHDASLDELLQKVWDGGRIDRAEALRLYALPLEELGALADRRRQLHRAAAHGGRGADTVTYIVDRNVNYTNVCNVYCKFCAFWRSEKDLDSYVISHAEMDKKIEETVALGGNQILMQGGHHPKLTKQWYLDLLAHIRDKFPGFNVHGFSPSEMVAFSEFFKEPVEQILKDFVAAGLGSVPGGGGEILVDRVRNRIAPLKANASEWMGVMDAAHRLGLASSITMMFGHVETVEDRIEHLEVVRAQQDHSLARIRNSEFGIRNWAAARSPLEQSIAYAHALETGALNGGAFTAFICWTFQPENAVLKTPTVGAHEYLRTQALSRIYLDNLPSVQSSWVTQGQEIGQLALRYGANDLGSIMIEENVVSAAGTTHRMSVADMQRLITDLGFTPRQRDNWYRLVK